MWGHFEAVKAGVYSNPLTKLDDSKVTAYSALVDSASNILLVLSSQVSGITFVHRCTADTVHIPSVQFPSYADAEFLRAMLPRDYPNWTWNREARKFIATRPDLITADIRSRSLLGTSKLRCVTRVTLLLNIARQKLRHSMDFQEGIYLAKRLQAQQFKDAQYNDDLILNYPYVLQYADFADITNKQAAENILLKAKMEDEYLAKTELLRLRYFGEIKQASQPSQLDNIYKRCRRECNVSKQI
jgi:hypothetical protein